MFDVMVDLETYGDSPGCGIISIGAVAARLTDERLSHPDMSPEFYILINRKSCSDYGLREDESTLRWWITQDDAARAAFIQSDLSQGFDLKEGLAKFCSWLSNFGAPHVRVWGNGSDFDNAILAVALKATKLEPPYKFWYNRCYRTLKSLHPTVKMPKREGTHHNALDDAKNQMDHLKAILKVRTRKGEPPGMSRTSAR